MIQLSFKGTFSFSPSLATEYERREDLLCCVTGLPPNMKSSAQTHVTLEVHTQMGHRCHRMKPSQQVSGAMEVLREKN